MAEVLEGTLLASVRGYAADAVGCSPDHVMAVSRFQDGNRHAVYKVSYLDAVGAASDLVIRVSYGGGAAECVQAEREARVLEKVGGVAAPLLYDFRRSSPWFDAPVMCMQFVAGFQTELSSATAADLEQLGSVVAWVHGRPADDLVDGPSAARTIAAYAEQRLQSIMGTLVWARDPLPAAIQARLRRAASLVQGGWEWRRNTPSFTSSDTLVLVHGEIAPGNILWGPDPVLIDWEYARLGDPADEIAYLFDQNGLAPDQRESFWRGYRDSVSSQSWLENVTDRVEFWEPVTLLGSTLWWVERSVRRTDADAAGMVDPDVPREQGYYFDNVNRRLDRLERLLVRQ